MTSKRRRRAFRTIGYDEVSEALDALAETIAATGNRKLLPMYEHLEGVLAKYDDDEAVLKRATKRIAKRAPKKRSRK